MRSICQIDDCQHPVHGRGWCEVHYGRWRRYGDPLGTPEREHDSGTCALCQTKRHALGLCARHYQRYQRYGDPFYGGDVCLVEGCSCPPRGRGYCQAHYRVLLKHGDPLHQSSITVPMGVDLPLAPLLAEIDRHGGLRHALASAGVHERAERERLDKMMQRARERGAIDVAVADFLAIRGLRTHPALIWGEDWWTNDIEHEEEQAA